MLDGGVAGGPIALRQVMGHFTSGVTIVTALRAGERHAMTATAVCSVSLEPPLVLVCVSKTSRFHEAIQEAGSWCLSLLAADQAAIARHFSNKSRDLITQFDEVPHEPAPVSGAPWLTGSLGWLDCVTHAHHDGGDHTIVVGRVMRASKPAPIDESDQKAPLTYYRGTYSSSPSDPR